MQGHNTHRCKVKALRHHSSLPKSSRNESLASTHSPHISVMPKHMEPGQDGMVTWVTQVPKGLHPIGKLCSPGAGCSIRSLPLHRQVRTDPQDEEDGLTGQVLSKETRPRRLPGGRAQRHPKCPECSAQLSSVSQSCLTLCNPTHGLQHARPPCPSPPPGIYPNSCLLSR